MRRFRFCRDLVWVGLVVVYLSFCVAVHMTYAGYLSVRKRVALAGLDARLVPHMERLAHLAWRLREAEESWCYDRPHCGRIWMELVHERRIVCAKPADGGLGISRWRVKVLGA